MKKILLLLLLSCIGFGAFANATVSQKGWRWRNDDGAEATATWAANKNEQMKLKAVNGNIRLRMEFLVNPDPSTSNAASKTINYRISYATTPEGPFTIIPTEANNNEHFVLSSSALVTNSIYATQQIDSGTGGVYSNGGVIDKNVTSDIIFTTPGGVTSVTEYEWVITPTANISTNTYYFMLSGLDGYNVLPALTYTAPPAITSNGGKATAEIKVAENTTVVTTVTATDRGAGSTPLPFSTSGIHPLGSTGTSSGLITYSLSGGADKAKFSMNSSTGVLSFVTAPDYENPVDESGNNSYEVTVRATGSGTEGLFDEQAITVTVTDVDEDVNPPSATITSIERGLTNKTAIPVTISFSEAVKGFDKEDLNIGNGSVTSLVAPGIKYLSTMSTTGSAGSESSQLFGPIGVAVDAAGKLYVTEYTKHRILVFNADGSYAATIGTGISGSGDNQLKFPTDVAIGADERVYVADAGNHRIQVFNADGSYAATIGSGTRGTENNQFDNPSGVCIDNAGKIYVADQGNQRIQVFNANLTYAATITGIDGGESNLIKRPFGITADEQGKIYVGDYENNRIQVFNADGSYVATIGTGIGGSEDNQLNNPMCIATDSDGKVYVVDSGNNRIQIFNADYTYSATVTGIDGGENNLLKQPYGIAVDTNGKIYIADYENNRIQIFQNGGNGYQVMIAPSADGLITVNLPAAVLTDKAGNENTAAEQFSITYDGTAPAVTIASPEGTSTSKAVFPVTFTFTEKVDDFDKADVTVGNGGITDWKITDKVTFTAEVTAVAHGAVTVDVAAGVANDKAGNGSTAATQFSIEYLDTTAPTPVITSTAPDLTNSAVIPVNIAFSEVVKGFAAEDLQIVNGTVASLTAPGLAYAATIGNGTFGKGIDQFSSPSQVAVAPSGKIYVADRGNHRIQIFNVDGTYAATLGTTAEPGRDNDHFNNPYGVAVDAAGKVYVADLNNHRIQVFNADGTYATTLGTTTETGSDNDHFNNPYGVAVDAAGKVYVADLNNHRIQVFNADGTYATTLGTTGETGSDNDHFNNPFNVAVDAVGKVYVADLNNHRIQVFNADGTYAATLGTTAETGSDNNHFYSPYGVAVDAAGRVYVADLNNHRIQIFNADGTYAATLGTTAESGSGNDHFNSPMGVAVNATGKIYVADLVNQRIQVFENSGAYQVMIAPTADGLVTVDLPAGAIIDEADNKNIAAEQFSIYYDGTAPTVAISAEEGAITSKSNLSVTISFSEAVSGFDIDAITASNGALTNLESSDNKTYTADLTITEEGPASLNIAAGVATDAAGNANKAAQEFGITLNINDAPAFTKGADQSIAEDAGAQTVVEWATAIHAGAPNENDQALTFEVTNDNAALFAVNPAVSADGTLTYTPAEDAHGVANVAVTLSDNGGTKNGGIDQSYAQTFSITVNPVNDDPIVAHTIPDQTAYKNQAFSYTIPVNSFEDIDTDDMLVLSAKLSNGNILPAWLHFDGTTGRFSGTPAVADEGSLEIMITASDNAGASASDTFVLEVVNPNTAPTDILLSTTEVEENKPAGTLVGTLTTVDADADDTHVYQLVEGEGSADNAYFFIEENQLFTNAAFDSEIRSSYSIRILSNDGNDGMIEKAMVIKVKNVADARVFIPNLFSPNGDGNNDAFRIRANGIDKVSFRIFNRWGEMVFETSNIHLATETGWDGRYKGKEMPSGSYVWQITGMFSDGTPVLFEGKNTGNITLIR